MNEGEVDTADAPAPTPSRSSRRRRQCDNCGARLRGRFCIRCGQRDRAYQRVECENCGAEKQGHFCAVCGQNDRNYRRNIFPVVGEVMAETFETDSRVVRTLSVLFTRPGFLAQEFSENRRARYLSPFRLYLFTSIVFFFVLSLTVDLPEGPGARGELLQRAERAAPLADDDAAQRPWFRIGINEDEPEERDDDSDEAVVAAQSPDVEQATQSLTDEAVATTPAEAGEPEPPPGALPLTAQQRQALDRLSPALDRWGNRQLAEIVRRPGFGELVLAITDDVTAEQAARLSEAPRFVIRQLVDVAYRPSDALRTWFEYLPVAMFCLLPVFALMLKIFYPGSRWFYSEHLVFAMQNHTVAYLVFTVMTLGPDESAVADVVSQLFMLGLAVYYFLAMRRFYGGGRFATTVKFLLLLHLYGFLLLAAMAGAAIAALLLA